MNRENKPLFLYTFITVFGGLIVGLNMAGISGAVPFLQEQFMLDDMALGLVVSILTVGCLCGALLGGGFSDRYGRQKVMFSSAVFLLFLLWAAHYPVIGFTAGFSPDMRAGYRSDLCRSTYLYI